MPRVRVYPQRPEAFDSQGRRKQPVTPMQALMESRPHDDAELSVLEAIPNKEIVADALDLLDDRERWVIEALFWRRMTLRQLGREMALSKTQIARIRDVALERLAAAISDVPPHPETD